MSYLIYFRISLQMFGSTDVRVLNICRPFSRIFVAVLVSVQMIFIRCVYCLILITSENLIHVYLFSISVLICSAECCPTYESSWRMNIVCLLLCSGGMTGVMFIFLKISVAFEDVSMSIACGLSVFA